MRFAQAGMVEIQSVAYHLVLNMSGMVEIQFVAYQLILKVSVRASEAGGAFRSSGHG